MCQQAGPITLAPERDVPVFVFQLGVVDRWHAVNEPAAHMNLLTTRYLAVDPSRSLSLVEGTFGREEIRCSGTR